MPDFGIAPLAGLVVMMIVSMIIGGAANKASEQGGFLQGYFLGNRGLGSWSMALTATVMSGGTFMGFPSLVYKHGWVLALWIASYMMVPLCTFAVLGKRMGQLSRETGAVTLPDLLRERFQSPALGVAASGLMVIILSVSLIAQFKAGAIVLQKVLPGLSSAPGFVGEQSQAYLVGLVVFAVVVIAYTIWGGFLAAVWTDVFQSVLMAVGVLILFPLALMKAGGLPAASSAGVAAVGTDFLHAPGADRNFLPLGLAASFFCMWSIAGMGQPPTLVRLMAFRDTRTLRQAIFMLAVYNTLIYLPLVLIFICARQILPNLQKPDEVMPTLALTISHPLVAGIILAAPFGAVMATVSGYLVQIASALVQDLYHRWFNRRATDAQLRRANAAGMLAVGAFAALLAVWPPPYLQAVIVFAGGAAACSFLVPALLACFWSRATASGALAAMLGGAATVIGLYLTGMLLRLPDPGMGEEGKLFPVYLGGIAPFAWGLLMSLLCGVVVSLASPKPPAPVVERFFGKAE